MDPGVSYLVALTFFQLVVAAALAGVRARARVATPAAGLLVLNGTLTGLDALVNSGFGGARIVPLFLALDSFTWVFLVAMWLATRPRSARGRTVLAGAVLANLPFVAFVLARGAPVDPWVDLLARALPLYAAYGVVVARLASGLRVERWVALALLPRALYFGFLPFGAEWGLLVLSGAVDYAARFALLAASGWALSRIVRGPEAIRGPVVIAFAATGPLLVAAYRALDGGALAAALNYASLGILRPLVLLVGLAPASIAAAIGRASFAAASAIGIAGVLEASGIVPRVSLPLGLAGGVAAFGVGEAIASQSRSRRGSRGSASGRGAEPPAPGSRAPPLWMLVLWDLHDARAGPPSERTQAAIAARLGTIPQRVSGALGLLDDAERLRSRLEGLGLAGASTAGPGVVQAEVLPTVRRGGPVRSYGLTPTGSELALELSRRFRLP